MTIEKEKLLQLSCVSGVGPQRLRALISHFRSPEKVLAAGKNALVQVPGVDAATAAKIATCTDNGFAQHQTKAMLRHGVRLVTFWDEEYPEHLKQVYDAPPFFFIKGEIVARDKYAIAVVGPRNPSNYGKTVATRLASELGSRGLTVVSGLAHGIDAIAHKSALDCGGRTIAVLGSGLDKVYPPENTPLFTRIAESAAVMSEFPMGTLPDRPNFPRRNRLISGLSLGVIVVEAGEKSGSLITASIALEQNREVFAVPGNIDSRRSVGANNLIKEGAQAVTCIEDVLDVLEPKLRPILSDHYSPVAAEQLTDEENSVASILSNEPMHVDLIAKTSSRTMAQTLSILLSLELKNAVQQHPGKLFVRL